MRRAPQGPAGRGACHGMSRSGDQLDDLARVAARVFLAQLQGVPPAGRGPRGLWPTSVLRAMLELVVGRPGPWRGWWHRVRRCEGARPADVVRQLSRQRSRSRTRFGRPRALIMMTGGVDGVAAADGIPLPVLPCRSHGTEDRCRLVRPLVARILGFDAVRIKPPSSAPRVLAPFPHLEVPLSSATGHRRRADCLPRLVGERDPKAQHEVEGPRHAAGDLDASVAPTGGRRCRCSPWRPH